MNEMFRIAMLRFIRSQKESHTRHVSGALNEIVILIVVLKG